MPFQTRSLFNSKVARIALVAVALMAVPNAWLALHTDRILDGVSLWEPIYLERRLAALEHRDRVHVIVLGNSHAMASLRPHQVAAAMGLPEGAVVSLAMPGASAWEMRLLVERFASDFPRARRVVCAIDPYLLTEDIGTRALYLSRRSWLDRLDYSQRFADLETKTRLLAGWFMPIADHSLSLKNLLKASPMGTLRQFVTLEPQPLRMQDFRKIPYAWGVPLPHDYQSAASMKALHARSGRTQHLHQRARHLVGTHSDMPRGLVDLDRLMGTLRARFAHVHLVDSPFAPGLEAVLETHHANHMKAYDRALDALTHKHGLARLSPPAMFVHDDFYDVDHLNPAGGKKYLRWLAAEVGPTVSTLSPSD